MPLRALPYSAGKAPGEKVGIGQQVGVQDGDRAAGSACGPEMVRVEDLHAVDPVFQAEGRVAADNDVVAVIAGAHHPGVIRRHAWPDRRSCRHNGWSRRW